MAVVSDHFVLRLAPRALVAVVALVALVPALLVIVGSEDEANALGGDFPSFYGAGRIVLDGDSRDLYDPGVQRAVQAPYHDDPDEFLYFAYPPFVAVAYAAIAWLPYGMALSVHALLALGALAWAVRLVVPQPTAGLTGRDLMIGSTAAALLAYPIVTAVLGGQNTTFTILLFALVWRALGNGHPVWAGAVGALTLSKPQFGLVLLAFVVVARWWAAVATFVAGGVALIGLTAIGWGWDWVATWLDQVQRFGDVNDVVNGPLMINIVGWIPNVWDQPAGDAVAIAVAAAVFVVSAALVWRSRLDARALGLVTAAVLLVAPSALFYDIGLALVGFAVVVLVVEPERRWLPFIGGAIVVSWSQLLASSLGWSPLFIVLLALWAYAFVREVQRLAPAQEPVA